MNCFVYKGDRKDDHYLYLISEFNPQSPDEAIPGAILNLMGELSLVIEFELSPDRKLPQADAQHVLDSMLSQGFYLQMPKKDMAAEEEKYFN